MHFKLSWSWCHLFIFIKKNQQKNIQTNKQKITNKEKKTKQQTKSKASIKIKV